jgi:apolipoprotein N-acyltransferase
MQWWKAFPARCAVALLSGGVFSLAYPPLGWGWLVVPGFVGLLAALERQRGTRARVIGFLHGMAAYGCGLSWLYEIFGVMVVMLWMVLAVFHALFAEMMARATARGVSGVRLAAFTALNWAGWEFVRAELFPLKFPWMTAGLAMGPNALLPWIGVYGAGALLVLAVALAWGRRFTSAGLIGAGLVACIFLFPKLPPPAADDPLAVRTGGVQLEGVTLDEFIRHTRMLPEDVPHVVWPEYAIAYDIRSNPRDWKLVRDLCRERDITLTFGTQLHEGGGNGWRNIALTVDPEGTRGQHNKVHPVHFFNDGEPGKTAVPIPTRHGKVGTPVCFDCDYETVTRRMTAAGAETFIVPIMDAKSWTERQHDQHAELFQIRAAENGRWMFVCATSGPSQVIDPHGHVHTRLGAMEKGNLLGTLRRETGLTVYTRIGWLVPWVTLGIAAVIWFFLLLPPKPSIRRDS